MRAHSATHLLDAVLHQVLGDHVHQAGSLVEPDKLRFDFTHFAALTAEELSQVSALVNEAVLEGYEVSTEVLPIEEAKQRGAIALFGEKYGDTVRVVDMGQGFSVEFCGGTHLDNTAKVGVFHIDSEFSVASGVRRIEATTGLKSLETMNRAQSLLFETAAVLKAKPAELREKAEQNMAELREMRHTVEKFQAREAAGETERFLMGGHDLGELKVLTATVPDADAGKLRKMGDLLRDKEPSVVGVLAAVSGDKITFLAVCGKEAVSKGVKAGDIIKNVTAICGGKGGGIGYGLSTAFAKEGCNLVITGRNTKKLDDAKEELERLYGVKVLACQADGGVEEQVAAVVKQAADTFGRIDFLINNAQNSASGVPLAEHTKEQFDQAIYSGLYAAFFYMKHCYPYLKETKGSVVNFASGAGLFGKPGQSSYAAAKEGIRGMTRVAATEWGPDGINCNLICPLVMTDALKKWREEYPAVYEQTIKGIPAGRFGDPEKDIGRTAVFLCSEDAKYISGETITMQGGSGLRP